MHKLCISYPQEVHRIRVGYVVTGQGCVVSVLSRKVEVCVSMWHAIELHRATQRQGRQGRQATGKADTGQTITSNTGPHRSFYIAGQRQGRS